MHEFYHILFWSKCRIATTLSIINFWQLTLKEVRYDVTWIVVYLFLSATPWYFTTVNVLRRPLEQWLLSTMFAINGWTFLPKNLATLENFSTPPGHGKYSCQSFKLLPLAKIFFIIMKILAEILLCASLSLEESNKIMSYKNKKITALFQGQAFKKSSLLRITKLILEINTVALDLFIQASHDHGQPRVAV